MEHIQGVHSGLQEQRVCRHPCFNNYDFHDAILHLPVATKQNLYLQSEESCMNCLSSLSDEKIVKSISYTEAIERYLEVKRSISNLKVAAISGPGEALEEFHIVRETFQMIRQLSPGISLCISTNGLLLPVYASHLISLGVNFINVCMDTVYPVTGGRIYQKIEYLGRSYFGEEAANILIQNQITGISYLTGKGIEVRVNVRVLPGMNEDEIPDILEVAKECGCRLSNVLYPEQEKNPEANGPEAYSKTERQKLRKEYEKILPQSYFCKPCAAATIETMSTRMISTDGYHSFQNQCENQDKTVNGLRFAVCSKNGILTDQHFGHAVRFHIYDYRDGAISFIEIRQMEPYAIGAKEDKASGRIYRLIKTIEDCNCVICMRIGACPMNALKEKDIDVYTTYHLIEDGIREAVNRLYMGRHNDM